jgi:hypothetical protein
VIRFASNALGFLGEDGSALCILRRDLAYPLPRRGSRCSRSSSASTTRADHEGGRRPASLLLQHGCCVHTLRKALTRNSDGSASGPLARALDLLAIEQQRTEQPS